MTRICRPKQILIGRQLNKTFVYQICQLLIQSSEWEWMRLLFTLIFISRFYTTLVSNKFFNTLTRNWQKDDAIGSENIEYNLLTVQWNVNREICLRVAANINDFVLSGVRSTIIFELEQNSVLQWKIERHFTIAWFNVRSLFGRFTSVRQMPFYSTTILEHRELKVLVPSDRFL